MTSNPGRTGTERELLVIKHLESQGYVVHRTVRNAFRSNGKMMSRGNDIWGCVDLMAKRRGEPVRYIQVTSRKGIHREREKLETVPWDDETESVEVWRWSDPPSYKSPPYFQIYYRCQGYAKQVSNRVYIKRRQASKPESG